MPYPGQPGNLVGHTAAPGWPGSFTGGTFTSSTPIASFGGLTSGASAGSPTVISFVDFDCGTNGTSYISSDGTASGSAVNNIRFVGCRFRSSNVEPTTTWNVECHRTHNDGITFSYCTFSPSVVTTPLTSSWPASSVGTGQEYQGENPNNNNAYLVTYKQGIFQHLSLAPPRAGTGCVVDHCDFWGMGNIAIGTGNAVGGVSYDGPITITDNWFHDNRQDTGPKWSSATSYAAGDVVNIGQALDSEIRPYRSLTGVGNINKRPDLNLGTFWEVLASTHDHTDAILPGSAPSQNIRIEHNTIASIAPGQALAFQRGGAAPDYYLATPWSIATAYVINNLVAGSDGQMYQLIVASHTGGTDPTGNADPTNWAQIGPAYYNNISIINNYLSGYGINTHLAPLMTHATNITFTGNIFATDILFSLGPGTLGGPVYQADNLRTIMVAANGNTWRRNVLRLYPGSGASYAAHFAAWDGFFIIPTSNAANETAGYSLTDWETTETLCFLLQEEAA